MVASIEKLMPNNCVVTALVLVDMKTLCVVRVEKGVEPILYRVNYSFPTTSNLNKYFSIHIYKKSVSTF